MILSLLGANRILVVSKLMSMAAALLAMARQDVVGLFVIMKAKGGEVLSSTLAFVP